MDGLRFSLSIPDLRCDWLCEKREELPGSDDGRRMVPWKEWMGNEEESLREEIGLLAQLVIRYTDGTEEIVTSDENWKAATGAVVWSDIYDGEEYDARLENAGWSAAGFGDKDWKGVAAMDAP